MRTMCRYKLLLVPFIAALWTGFCNAQPYPSQVIRIATAGIGGGSDTVARTIADDMSATLKQSIVIENFAGSILVPRAAKAVPDGYNLLVTGNNLWVGPLFGDMPYDPVRDFAPIAALTRQSTILVVHPSLPVHSVPELIKLAKAQPGKLNYTSGTNGASSHIAGELFKSMAKVDITRIVYKAQGPELTDLLTGQVHLTFGNGPTMGPLVHAGRVRALATAGAKRSVLFPNLPTVGETVPGYSSEQLIGLFAPAKTPDAIIRRLNQEAVHALERPQVKERLLKNGLETIGGPPDELGNAIKADIARMSKLIKEAGVKSGGM